MTLAMPLPVDADPLRYPLIAQLFAKHGFARVEDGDPDGFTQRPGRTLVLFLEDPVRYRETLDLAVIVPELARAFPGRFAVVVALAATARKLAVRYGFRKWPAFVMLRRRPLRRRGGRAAQLGRVRRRSGAAARRAGRRGRRRSASPCRAPAAKARMAVMRERHPWGPL